MRVQRQLERICCINGEDVVSSAVSLHKWVQAKTGELRATVAENEALLSADNPSIFRTVQVSDCLC